MAKEEGYRNYELETNVISQINLRKIEVGITKDFTVNKAIEYFFKNRVVSEGEEYGYVFNPIGRKNIYFYLKKESFLLLEKEREITKKPFNHIINEAVKFYLKNIL